MAFVALGLHFASHHVSVLFPDKSEAWRDSFFWIVEQLRAVFMYGAWYFVGIAIDSKLIRAYGAFAFWVAIAALFDDLAGIGSVFSIFEESMLLFALTIAVHEYNKKP